MLQCKAINNKGIMVINLLCRIDNVCLDFLKDLTQFISLLLVYIQGDPVFLTKHQNKVG